MKEKAESRCLYGDSVADIFLLSMDLYRRRVSHDLRVSNRNLSERKLHQGI